MIASALPAHGIPLEMKSIKTILNSCQAKSLPRFPENASIVT
jgi:hypothetical protein